MLQRVTTQALARMPRAARRCSEQPTVIKTRPISSTASTKPQLAPAIFPLAGLSKPRVRALADQVGFRNYDKPDSTGICFIGERDFQAFLKRYIDTTPGPIVQRPMAKSWANMTVWHSTPSASAAD